MNLALHIVGGFALATLGAYLMLMFLVRRHERHRAQAFARAVEVMEAIDEAMHRHPAGTAEEPFKARSECGHLIYGDSLGDMVANQIHHAQLCPYARKESA